MFIPRVEDVRLPPVVVIEPETSDLIKTVAVKCLKEFAVSLTSGVVVGLFVASPAGIAFMFSATLVQLAVSVCFHSLGAFASQKARQGNESQIHYERLLAACEWVTGANFALLTGYNAQTLIHESGHAWASLLFYKNPRPVIELYPIGIYPLVGGVTQFYKTNLSALGIVLVSNVEQVRFYSVSLCSNCRRSTNKNQCRLVFVLTQICKAKIYTFV